MKIEVISTKGPKSYTVIMTKKPYSTPKLYIPRKNGVPIIDAKKPWYVYFYGRNEKGISTLSSSIKKASTFKNSKGPEGIRESAGQSL